MKKFTTILNENIPLMGITFLISFFMVIIGLAVQFDSGQTGAYLAGSTGTYLELAYIFYYLSAINIVISVLMIGYFTIKEYLNQ